MSSFFYKNLRNLFYLIRPGTAGLAPGEKGIRTNRHAVRKTRMTCLFFRSVVSRVHCHRFDPNPAAVPHSLYVRAKLRPAKSDAHGGFWELYIFLWFFNLVQRGLLRLHWLLLSNKKQYAFHLLCYRWCFPVMLYHLPLVRYQCPFQRET